MLDVIFSIVFTVEMVLKVVAFGLYGSGDTYLHDPWNVMDGSIVILALLSLFLGDASFSWIRSLRTVKVMRPLRVITRVPELRVVVAALFKSVPELVNVALVSAVIWLIFGILGMQVRKPPSPPYAAKLLSLVQGTFIRHPCTPYSPIRKQTTHSKPAWGVFRLQLFLGKFVRCSDSSITTKVDCVGDMALSQLRLREWIPLEGAEAVWGCSDPTVLLQVSTRTLLTRSSSV